MEKRIIVEGNRKAIRDIMQENRIRVERGDLKFVEFHEREKERVSETNKKKGVDPQKERVC